MVDTQVQILPLPFRTLSLVVRQQPVKLSQKGSNPLVSVSPNQKGGVRMGRDKRTPNQINDDLAQKVKPHSAEDTRFVTTGPATGIEDERAIGTENAEKAD